MWEMWKTGSSLEGSVGSFTKTSFRKMGWKRAKTQSVKCARTLHPPTSRESSVCPEEPFWGGEKGLASWVFYFRGRKHLGQMRCHWTENRSSQCLWLLMWQGVSSMYLHLAPCLSFTERPAAECGQRRDHITSAREEARIQSWNPAVRGQWGPSHAGASSLGNDRGGVTHLETGKECPMRTGKDPGRRSSRRRTHLVMLLMPQPGMWHLPFYTFWIGHWT